MNTKNEHELGAAEELESQADHRDEGRLEVERDEQEDLNQGMQTGTHDAFHSGIKWGSSYRVKERTTSPKKASNVRQNDSDGNS
jgi:flagellar biosynthesis/type III secretory pathway protein FliH